MSTGPLRDRDPLRLGIAGLLAVAAVMVLAFNASSLPFIGGGDTYSAAFSEAGGLRDGDDVRIAGVKVGDVTGVDLDGAHVRVDFRITEDASFGPQTAASIRIKTLLGAMYLALEPAGGGQLAEEATIPVERTTSPYDVVEAFAGLAETSEKIDTDQLTQSLSTLADLGRNTPDEFRETLEGVSALSQTLASRDQQINTLLTNLQKVSGVLGDRSDDIVTLMKDGDVLFKALVARRQAIHNLLVSTSTMSEQLTLLIRQSRADLKPALSNLDTVVKVLLKNQDNLDSTLRLMAPFYRVFANTLGNGPWFDTYIYNLPPIKQVG